MIEMHNTDSKYLLLWDTLRDAWEQAANGKGKERHQKDDEPFEDQPICAFARRVGLGYPLGQAMKKIDESARMEPEAAVREILGAINYLAAAVIVLREQMEKAGMKITDYIQDHIAWSKKTFGTGRHTEGLCKHITKELDEIRQAPLELEEWIDVMILAIDGAWRAGYSPKAISNALHEKQQINKNRLWGPVVSEDEPIEHVRSLAGVLGEK